ncbi:hypothetical protein Tsubulata_033382 [Turnera subulata]|uniref:Uncharacterized protein n=1 Tax=Turnera subulata TaxID=218843 RepID=A0A9Q0GL49_9ROSI|nr:hypothetical protein Tsubulata_033382 [Turnera subulata]
MGGVSAFTPCGSICSLQSKAHSSCYNHKLSSVNPRILRFSDTKLKTQLGLRSDGIGVRCNSSSGPGGFGSGDGDSRNVLDAFFLGKALAEALNERVESAVGEFLSTVGRLQAEQQRQIQDFQEDVFERAKRAKEKAAREAMEAQGIVRKPSSVDATPVNGATPENSASSTETTINSIGESTDPAEQGPVIGVSDDD